MKKEGCYRASETDLMRHLERQGVARDIVRRVVTLTAKHLFEKDYDGIKKAVNQIPLAYFEPPPRPAEAAERVCGTHPCGHSSTIASKDFQQLHE